MTEFEATDWQARLRAATEETLRALIAKKAERAEFKRRRDLGLAARHRAKLARLNRPPNKEE